MTTHAIPSLSAVVLDTSRLPGATHAAAAPRAGATARSGCLDFAGRAVHLDAAAIGPVVAWYFGAKPRRDATLIAVGRRAWRGGRPDVEVQAHAAALIERGDSVLLVDLRRSERPWSRWMGCTRTRIVQAGLDYLEDRGYDVATARVVHAD